MMATIELNKKNFENVLGSKGIVLVDFWASWCGPCKMFGPVFEASAKKHPKMTFAKMDTQAEPELAGALQIQSIPTLMILREGIPVYRKAGALPPAALESLIKSVQELDMDEVRAKVESELGKAKVPAGKQQPAASSA